jgi:hypothetical protein
VVFKQPSRFTTPNQGTKRQPWPVSAGKSAPRQVKPKIMNFILASAKKKNYFIVARI